MAMRYILLVLALQVIGCSDKQEKNHKTQMKQTDQQVKAIEPLSDNVSFLDSAGVLHSAFAINEAAAEAKYKGKTVAFQSFIKLLKNDEGKFQVHVNVVSYPNLDGPPGIIADIDPARFDEWASSKPGDVVWVRGRVVGRVNNFRSQDGFHVLLESACIKGP